VKLKLKKSFQPCPVDDGDELFPNGIFEFNVTKLIAHIETNTAEFPIEEIAVETLGLTSSQNLDEPTVQSADLSRPIVLAEIGPGRFNVVDGNHRVEKARRDGIKSLLSYRVGPDHHHRFLTSVEAYKVYVQYWNEKVAADARLLRFRTRSQASVVCR
jgi:hypothetical protein